jgi:GNAT superfamily N-acetyltransferase
MSKEYIREVLSSDPLALKRFVTLVHEVMASHPLFYSELDSDVLRQLSGKSSFFRDMRYALFIASNGAHDVARCAALINPQYQDAKNEPVGFIGYFAAAPGYEPQVKMMLEHAEAWLSNRGVTRIIAPYNGSVFLGSLGLRTDAFDEEPAYPFGWHPPYYADYFKDSGYTPTYPLLSYVIDFSSERYRSMVQRACDNTQVRVRAIERRTWNNDLETVRRLLNETFTEEWEHCPTTSDQFHEILDSLKPILDTRQTLIAEVDDNPAGFCWGMPDWAPLFRTLKGKLGPRQIIKLLLGSGHYLRAGLIMIGVLPDQRGKGVARKLAAALFRRYEQKGLEKSLYHLVNENNTVSRLFAESMGGKGRVIYHVYDKKLN